MSPQQIKKIRESFGLTQSEFAACLGLTQKTMSQYEMGFRAPGPTVKVIVKALDLLPTTQAKKLLELMLEVAEKQKKENLKRSSL